MKAPKAVSGVYGILNLVSQKLYVGSAVNMYRRFQRHRATLRGKYHANARLQNSYNKHGEDNFFFFVIEYVDGSVVEREQYWMNTLKPEYNLIVLAQDRKTYSAETRAKMSQSMKARYASGWKCHLSGKERSEETKQRWRESMAASGYRHTKETTQGIGEKLMRYYRLSKDGESVILRSDKAAVFLSRQKCNISRAVKSRKLVNGYQVDVWIPEQKDN